jgi:probable rRNA maturation factor
MASSGQDREIVIALMKNFNGIDISAIKINKLTKAICNRFTQNESQDKRYEISIAIVDDDKIRQVNREFFNSNDLTDCISFDLSENDERLKVFDLVVNGQMAVRQANQRGHSSEAELALYITHGLLHNLGFDDLTKSQARKMHETEDEILQEFGYGIVYNNSTK